ncbi:MAG: hypothetical protein ACM3NO_01940 [Deltaproteobacteria bacterium]
MLAALAELGLGWRYLPGLVAALGGFALIAVAPPRRKMTFTCLATLLGLVCMEAEYWVARGFPWSDMLFFVGSVAVTVVAMLLGRWGGLLLGGLGLGFFAYVNIRYGAPYLLDYVMPVFYAVLLATARREIGRCGGGVLRPGVPEIILLIVVNALAVLQTSAVHKWGWITGGPWRRWQ